MNYFVTYLPVLVKCENPTGGRSWFFILVGHKVFHIKILVFIIFRIICLLLNQEQPVSKISLTDCLRKLGKNTIHPPLVSCTLKSTSGIRAGFLFQKINLLRRSKDEYSTRYARGAVHHSSTLLQRTILRMVEKSDGELHPS